MKVVVDCRALSAGRTSGVEVYTISLLRALFRAMPHDEFVLFFNAFRAQHVRAAWARDFANVRIVRTRMPNKVLNAAMWLLRFPRIDHLAGGADVVFLPNIAFAAVSRRARLVTTVHDLSFVHMSHTFSWKRRLWHFFVHPRALVRRSTCVVAVSNATRDDLIATYRIAPRRIHVVPNAAAARYRVIDRNDPTLLAVKERYKLPYRFFLFLGAFEPRKNIAGLVAAYETLRTQRPDITWPLVIAGSSGWRERAMRAQIAASPYAADIRCIGFVAEEDKPQLYNLATAFIYPSFFEGFGLPVVEAMACGVPVVAGNASALPEVAGDAAILIDPDRPEEIAYAMAALHDEPALRTTLAQRGVRRAAYYDWGGSARALRAVLRQCAT